MSLQKRTGRKIYKKNTQESKNEIGEQYFKIRKTRTQQRKKAKQA